MTFRPARRRLLAFAAGGMVIGASPRAEAQRNAAPIVQPRDPGPAAFAARAEEMRLLAIARGDQPYGAIVVKAGLIVGEGASAVITDLDPTAHAEMQAIRDAARRLRTNDLSGCELYGTSRACPMCEAAAYWARIARLRHGAGPAAGEPPSLR